VSGSGFKPQLFDQFARIGKALGNGRRLELLELLAQGERGVEALAQAAHLSIANTSQHLQQLLQVGLVSNRREGQSVRYRLADERIVELMAILRALAERSLAEVGRLVATYLTTKDDLEPVSAEDLRRRMRARDVVVLDVRPEEEYRAGHLSGALGVPLAELERRLAEIPADREIVAYCRGPHCILSYEAVARLRAAGRQARRYEDGFPEWKLAGLPVEED